MTQGRNSSTTIDVRGVQAYRFHETKVGSLDSVITTPFDVISPERRAQLALSSPYNMSHLLLPEAVARTFDGVEQRLWRVPYDEQATQMLCHLRPRCLTIPGYLPIVSTGP